MGRTAGNGLLGLGIVMVAIGAILKYSVTVQSTSFNINTVGLIVLLVGIVAFVVGLVGFVVGGRHRSTITRATHSTPTGQRQVEEREDWAP